MLAPGAEWIVSAASEAQALCFFVPDVIDRALIARLPQLKVLAAFGKGYDNVDVNAASERGIWVTNVPNALTEATADMAFALLLASARRVAAGDALVRDGLTPGWHPARLLGSAVYGARLGLLGFGAIGRALARRASGFAMQVTYYDPVRPTPGIERAYGVRYAERDEVLRRSDHVVIAYPLDPRAPATIGARELALLPPHATLVNIARGSLVDEAAIAAALGAGTLGAFASDVFALEDPTPSRPAAIDPALLRERERTVLTPHLGTAVLADRAELARVQARCVLQALRGERPLGAVNDVAPRPTVVR